MFQAPFMLLLWLYVFTETGCKRCPTTLAVLQERRERSVLGIVETEYLYLNQPCYVSKRKGILIYTILNKRLQILSFGSMVELFLGWGMGLIFINEREGYLIGFISREKMDVHVV